MKNLLSRRFLIIFSLISICISGIAILPLCRDFHYEYAALSSLLLTILAGQYYFPALRNKDQRILDKYFFLQLFAFSVIPVFVLLAGGTIRWNHAVLYGLPFVAAYAIPAPFIGFTLAYIAETLLPRYRVWMFLIIIISIALLPIVELYLFRNLFFYNPLIVFFPGNIYDENIPLSLTQLVYRIINVLYFGGIVLLFIKKALRKRTRYLLLGVWALAGMLFWSFAPLLGLSTNGARLQWNLLGKVETQHFTILFDSDSFTSHEAGQLGTLHEAYYTELEAKYQSVPNHIYSYIFASSEQKYRLLGAGNADYAKPFQYCVFTTKEDLFRSLKHEIAHVCSGVFGYSPLRLSYHLNPMVLEGTATAVSDNFDEFNLDYLAFLAVHYKPDMSITDGLSGAGFFISPSTTSYIVSGAFCKWLMHTEGINKYREFYGRGLQAAGFSRPLPELEKEFILTTGNLQYRWNENLTQYYFNRQSIFQKSFPHLTASLLDEIVEDINRGDYSTAEKNIWAASRFTNQPRFVFLKATIQEKLYKYADAAATLSDFINQNPTSPYINHALLKYGDIQVLRDMHEDARVAYNRVLSLGWGTELTTEATLKRLLLETPGYASYLQADFKRKHDFLLFNAKASKDFYFIWALIKTGMNEETDYRIVKDLLNTCNFDLTNNNPVPFVDIANYLALHGDYPTASALLDIISRRVIPEQKEYVQQTLLSVQNMWLQEQRTKHFYGIMR